MDREEKKQVLFEREPEENQVKVLTAIAHWNNDTYCTCSYQDDTEE